MAGVKKEKFISVEAASRRLDRGINTIYRMIQDGRLGGTKEKGIGGKYNTWKVSVTSIELYEENRRMLSNYEVQAQQNLSLF